MDKLYYFGTELNMSGHSMWEMGGSQLHRNQMTLGDCPFNPEALPYLKYNNGDLGHYQCFGFSILAICGSCQDARPGSKSVFWAEGIFTLDEMKSKILSIPIGKQIIDKMPFKINW